MTRSSHSSVRSVTILAAAVSLVLGACAPGEEEFASNGERIYVTGTSESDEPIEAVGAAVPRMHRLACADCHGIDGTGGEVRIMMRTIDAPDITWTALTVDHDHGDHPPYTRETLRRAITEGLDPAGEPLSANMPRFRMAESDLDDLVEYMTTLGNEPNRQ